MALPPPRKSSTLPPPCSAAAEKQTLPQPRISAPAAGGASALWKIVGISASALALLAVAAAVFLFYQSRAEAQRLATEAALAKLVAAQQLDTPPAAAQPQKAAPPAASPSAAAAEVQPEPPKLAMYQPGDLPVGKVYSVPQLEGLAGKSLGNAWIYGTFKVKGKNGNTWTFRSWRQASGFLIDTVSGEGSTTLFVEFPDGRFPRADVGDVINVERHVPFELLSVKKGADGKLTVKARNRVQYN